MAKAKISDFRPQQRNANRHTQRGLGMLDKSMADNGFIGAMTSAADGEIFDGSARLETAYDRFGEKVEPIVIDADGTRPIIVRRTDIPSADDPRAKKLAIAANRIAQVDLDWDPELLKMIGEEIDISDLFFDNEIENLFEDLEEPEDWEEKEEDEDALSESLENIGKVESRVKLGEIWQLGRHKIACGDSTIEANVRALLGDRKCQMCWTDPPYNVNYDPEARVSHFSKERLANPIGKIENDSMSNEDFLEFLMKAYKGIDLALTEGSPIYISHADTMGHHFRNAFVAMPWKLQSCLIWKKSVLVFGRADYHWMHEPILYGWKEGAAHRYFGDRKQTTILEFPSPHYDKENCDTDGYIHSCQKPTPLISYCIENSTESNDSIYEPFLGSGATLIAAQKMEGDRTVYGFELSPDYCEVIIQRYENFTGDTAKLVGNLSQ